MNGRLWTSAQDQSGQESIRKPVWGDLDGWRRNKRDVEDRMMLASRRRAAAVGRQRPANNADEEFAIDDGDEDAWVHDGIDDIQIDPETKRAASEISSSLADDTNTIDSEYEPQQQQVLNRTKVTTISEVIPIDQARAESSGDDPSDSSTRLSSRYVKPNSQDYLPAALLSLDQARQLIDQASYHQQRQQQQPYVTWRAQHNSEHDPRWRR